MSAPQLETFLTQLYLNDELRREFIANPEETARVWGLHSRYIGRVKQLDFVGLELAARSFKFKRTQTSHRDGSERRFARFCAYLRSVVARHRSR